ncbi:MAG: DsbE family thiol:disulfide interchange protein [Proteobacteria bacterium]|nr:DsbE family thiol:disulfide interchange protein [Pseudomonadota bacterium]
MFAPQFSPARFAPIAVFALVALGLGLALTRDPRKMPSMLIDRPMPRFSLPALDSTAASFDAAELSGKVSLVNVFASWCGACKVEHPTLLKLASEKTVPLYGINWKDRPGDGLKWLKAHQSPYLKVGEDTGGRLGIDLGVTGVPETFVVDKTGRVRYRHAGPITDEVWRDTFEPLLASLRSER